MPSTTSLLSRLQQDYPNIIWQPSDSYHWNHRANTITYDSHYLSIDYLLHELGHALLGHQEHHRAIELVGMERDAWAHARTVLAPTYGTHINIDVEQSALDSYRDWIHARSTCPRCKSIGIETTTQRYTCPACTHTWRVNEARSCGLKRYSKK